MRGSRHGISPSNQGRMPHWHTVSRSMCSQSGQLALARLRISSKGQAASFMVRSIRRTPLESWPVGSLEVIEEEVVVIGEEEGVIRVKEEVVDIGGLREEMSVGMAGVLELMVNT